MLAALPLHSVFGMNWKIAWRALQPNTISRWPAFIHTLDLVRIRTCGLMCPFYLWILSESFRMLWHWIWEEDIRFGHCICNVFSIWRCIHRTFIFENQVGRMSYEKSTDLIQVGLPVKQSFQQVLRIFSMYYGYMYELTIYMYVCMYVCLVWVIET